MTPVHLIFDADDTLWENNIYFERAFDEFVVYLDHSTLTPEEVRAVLDELELVNTRIHGYGSMQFGRNLQQVFEHLSERHISESDLKTVMGFAERILEQPIELMSGVEQTLEYLASRHELTICTKGHFEEQKLKIERSGIGRFFAHAEIVKEKTATAYRSLTEARAFDPDCTWMVGNSPKSDINPALEAGLNAVYIPHPRTWILEKTEIREVPGRLLKIENFEALREHF
ncbi:MAG TPA: HAD hydrolase-like protein [Bryobacteraceae bacterium]|jgi:putative hydrolase of the HAD superfamily